MKQEFSYHNEKKIIILNNYPYFDQKGSQLSSKKTVARHQVKEKPDSHYQN